MEISASFLFKEKEPALTKYSVGVLSKNFTLDISKAKELLNYKPIISTNESINEFVDWYNNKNKNEEN
jgi:nucleoside-diphosphate-sugar epimerase